MLILTAAEFGNCFTLRPATVGSAEQMQINHPQPLLSKEGGYISLKLIKKSTQNPAKIFLIDF